MAKLNITPAPPDEGGKVVGMRDDRIVARGRDGEELTRRRSDTIDPYDLPQGEIPSGWAYQWVAESVFGDQHVVMDQRRTMHDNGWRPVPVERHPGRFTFEKEGVIRRGGLILCERPIALQREAQEESLRAANQQIQDRNDSVGLAARKAMPSGFEMGGKYRGTQPQVNISIDPGGDIPRPAHQTEGGGE